MSSTKRKIGILFHKSPFVSANGIDQVRLRSISSGLRRLGFEVEIIAPTPKTAMLDNGIMVRPLKALSRDAGYDLIKTSYHGSVKHLSDYGGPVVSRIVRVVDNELPERDESNRSELIAMQKIIKNRASVVVVNNEANRQRWLDLYGDDPQVEMVPTGCPERIPEAGKNPFKDSSRNILFLGSLAAPRMVMMLNEMADRLKDIATVHLVGLNKACMYGGDESCVLSEAVIDHGELPEKETWNYILYADLGLAFATGPHVFDNDMSKIFNYLRGGLPVLSEDPIINNSLIREMDYGEILDFGDVEGLVRASATILSRGLKTRSKSVMDKMAAEHSWLRRAEVYEKIFNRLLG